MQRWWSRSGLNVYFFPLLLPSLALKSTVLDINCKASPSPSLLPLRSSFLLPLLVVLLFLHFAVAVRYCGGAIGDGLASLLRGGRFASVRVVVEVGEEDDEGDSITDQSPLHPGREWAACVEGVASVADGHMELDLEKQAHSVIKRTVTLEYHNLKKKMFSCSHALRQILHSNNNL